MHEMALMNGVFEVIERAISEHDVQRVLQVRLKVGELTNADKEALELAFEAYAKGTPCEGAELIVQRIPVKARCTICQQEFLVNNVIFSCPKCINARVEIIQGEELLLESLEVE